jgi:hypothetical protein
MFGGFVLTLLQMAEVHARLSESEPKLQEAR